MAIDSKEADQHGSFGAFSYVRDSGKLHHGVFLRYSFSSFARGRAGTVLLVIRSVIGLTVVSHEVRILLSNPPTLSSAISVVLIVAGILLIVGLWTPIAAILVGVFQGLVLFSHPPDPWLYLRLGIFASALAMIGPGAWSVDARLFGWKRLDFKPAALPKPE